jgi:hypothetical protein
MKRFRNFGFQIGTGCLFIACSALTCFASCAAQDQHSGYQGIPVRNGLDRQAIEQVESVGAHAYSGLPKSLYQTERDAAYSASTAQDQQCAVNAEASSAYSGIPQTTFSRNAAMPDDVPDMLPVDSAGYSGIPQSTDVSRNSFARTASAFVRPK